VAVVPAAMVEPMLTVRLAAPPALLVPLVRLMLSSRRRYCSRRIRSPPADAEDSGW